jgi:hypothetical protein
MLYEAVEQYISSYPNKRITSAISAIEEKTARAK